MQAWLIHSCRPGLSFKIKNDYNTSRISCNFFLLFFIIFDIFHEILNFCTIFYTYHDFLDIIRKNEYDNQCFLKYAGLQLKKGEYLCSHRQTIVMIPVSGRNVVFSAFTIWMVPTSVLRSTMPFRPAAQRTGACGIAVSDTSGPKGHVKSYKGLGLVNEVFKESKLEELSGNIGIGHVRYSTTGSTTVENAQPLVLNYLKGSLALAHNGNLVNAMELREQMENTGAIFTLRLTLKSSPTALRGNAFIPKR